MIYVPWFVLSSGQAQLELSHPNVRGVALHLHQWKIDVVPRLVWRPEQRTSFCLHFVRTIVGGWIVMHVRTLAMKQLYGASKSWFRSYLPLLNGDGRVMDYITNHQGKISPHVALVYGGERGSSFFRGMPRQRFWFMTLWYDVVWWWFSPSSFPYA